MKARSVFAPYSPQYRRGCALKICRPLIRTRNTQSAFNQWRTRVATLWRYMTLGSIVLRVGCRVLRGVGHRGRLLADLENFRKAGLRVRTDPEFHSARPRAVLHTVLVHDQAGR